MRLISDIKEQWFRIVMIAVLIALSIYPCWVIAKLFKCRTGKCFEASHELYYIPNSAKKNLLFNEAVNRRIALANPRGK
jgi:hypothetical protein